MHQVDDAFVVAARDAGANEVRIYLFDGSSLTLTASSRTFGVNANSVNWHPSSYYVAMGLERNLYYELSDDIFEIRFFGSSGLNYKEKIKDTINAIEGFASYAKDNNII